jgi:hypothetical protein
MSKSQSKPAGRNIPKEGAKFKRELLTADLVKKHASPSEGIRQAVRSQGRKVSKQSTQLLAKIEALPEGRIAEVEDFVDFISLRERSASVREAMALSEPVFAAVWDNPADAVYDDL